MGFKLSVNITAIQLGTLLRLALHFRSLIEAPRGSQQCSSNSNGGTCMYTHLHFITMTTAVVQLYHFQILYTSVYLPVVKYLWIQIPCQRM